MILIVTEYEIYECDLDAISTELHIIGSIDAECRLIINIFDASNPAGNKIKSAVMSSQTIVLLTYDLTLYVVDINCEPNTQNCLVARDENVLS